jgi:shikimate 5-dehydrogenase
MKKYLVIGNPIEHSLSPHYIIIGLKVIILMQFMKKKIR